MSSTIPDWYNKLYALTALSPQDKASATVKFSSKDCDIKQRDALFWGSPEDQVLKIQAFLRGEAEVAARSGGMGLSPGSLGGKIIVEIDTTKMYLISLQHYRELEGDWPKAPSIAELAVRMQAPLKCKDGSTARLPVADQLYYSLLATDLGMAEVVQPVSQCGAHCLSVLVSAALVDVVSAPTDEHVLGGYVDDVLWKILNLVGRTVGPSSITRKRNSCEQTLTSVSLKPDFLLLVHQTLLMKGEDKTFEVEMSVAKQELRDKLKGWSVRHHGAVEYLVSYAAAGLNLQFCALGREKPIPFLSDLGRQFNLSIIRDRVLVMMCALKLFPVIMYQASQLPTSTRPVGTVLPRPNGTTITFWDDWVEKAVNCKEQPINAASMRSVYNAAAGCSQLVQLRSPTEAPAIHGGIYKVHLAPFGIELSTLDPPKEEALRHAIKCVLNALRWLHMKGWGHGDVRWENVIQVTDRSYMLIDLESALRLGTNVSTEQPFPRAWGDAGAALEEGVFTARSDLYMVGALMRQAGVDEGEGALLKAALLNKSLDVDAALSHAWLAVN